MVGGVDFSWAEGGYAVSSEELLTVVRRRGVVCVIIILGSYSSFAAGGGARADLRKRSGPLSLEEERQFCFGLRRWGGGGGGGERSEGCVWS